VEDEDGGGVTRLRGLEVPVVVRAVVEFDQ
jgi:hypothetical protein